MQKSHPDKSLNSDYRPTSQGSTDYDRFKEDEHSMSGDRWEAFREAVRDHWPMLTDAEVDSTEGEMTRLKNLVANKLGKKGEAIDKEIELIVERISSGNPQTIDQSFGIDKAQESTTPPDSNEWEAREDTNNP